MNHQQTVANTSRRAFLKTSTAATGGLIMGVSLPLLGAGAAQAAGTVHTPNAWVHIADDNRITLMVARSEMGQGVYTSMSMLIAEELNVGLKQVQVVAAPPAAVYVNALLGAQITGGSTSVRDGWEKLRVAGAQVRQMLLQAAANQWSVDVASLKADQGMVTGPSGRKASYGQLAEAAAKLPVPESPSSKTRKTSCWWASAPNASTPPPRSMARPSSASTSSCPAWSMPRWLSAR